LLAPLREFTCRDERLASDIRNMTTVRQRASGGILLFLASFFLYSLVSPGNIPGDSELRWSVAKQMVRGRGVHLEDGMKMRNGTVTVGEKCYALCSPGQSICMLPFAATGLGMGKIGGVGPKTADLAAQFLASIVLFPAIGAVLVWLFYRLVLALGYRAKTAIFSSAVLAFGTMNLHYSVNTQEQSQVALLLVLALLFLVRHFQGRGFVYAWLFCVVLGICLLFRMTSAVMVFPFYLAAAMSEVIGSDKKNLSNIIGKWLAAGALGTGGFIIVGGWYNFIRFGSVLESGYGLSANTVLGGHGMFESAPLPTLAAMLFSPGKSIFFYNPVLLLSAVCVWFFYRRHGRVALAACAVIAGNFVFYSFFTTWAGDYAWSVRYQVPVLPFLVLPIVVLLSRPMKGLMKVGAVSLVTISCVIQFASVAYNFNLEFVQNPNHNVIPDGWVWDLSQSHLVKRFENIGRHAAGSRDFGSVPVIKEEPGLLKINRTEQAVRNAYLVNFFPFKARGMLDSRRLFYPLLCLWVVLLAGFCAAAVKLVGLWLRLRTAED